MKKKLCGEKISENKNVNENQMMLILFFKSVANFKQKKK